MCPLPRFLAAMACVLLAGCTSHKVKNPTSLEVFISAPGDTVAPPYLLQPGDQLEIRFFHMPEQNVILPVRPDGRISLPLAHEVQAAGKTPDELRRTLEGYFERELLNPEIAVVVRSFTAYKVHVGGEVRAPGVFELNNKRTALQAIFEAGGVTPEGDLENVVVLRQKDERTVMVVPLNLEKVLSGADLTQNIELWPGDAIFVPRSAIANMNLWVEQYIRNNLPFDVGWRLEI